MLFKNWNVIVYKCHLNKMSSIAVSLKYYYWLHHSYFHLSLHLTRVWSRSEVTAVGGSSPAWTTITRCESDPPFLSVLWRFSWFIWWSKLLPSQTFSLSSLLTPSTWTTCVVRCINIERISQNVKFGLCNSSSLVVLFWPLSNRKRLFNVKNNWNGIAGVVIWF